MFNTNSVASLPDGSVVHLDSWPKTFTYNADGTVASITAIRHGDNKRYRQTFTYTAGKLTAISAWTEV